MPRFLLVSDPRVAELTDEVERQPPGSGVILRHYEIPDRAVLAATLADLCRRRGLTLLIAADPGLAEAVGAEGLHLPEGLARNGLLHKVFHWHKAKPGRVLTVAAHSPAALVRARAIGADAALLSPAFATASHPGARGLGSVRLAAWSRLAGPLPVLALGGMRARTWRRINKCGLHGYAGTRWNGANSTII